MTPSDPSPAPPLSLPFLVSRWAQFYALTKPRVIQLIVFCALIGSYGLCTDCDTLIPQDRLSAMPEAPRCMPCQSKAELLLN